MQNFLKNILANKILFYSCEKDHVWGPGTCTCINGKYLENVIDYSIVVFDEITETVKINPIVINKKSIS